MHHPEAWHRGRGGGSAVRGGGGCLTEYYPQPVKPDGTNAACLSICFIIRAGTPAAEAALGGKKNTAGSEELFSPSSRKSDDQCCGHFTSVCFIFIMLCPLDHAPQPHQ